MKKVQKGNFGYISYSKKKNILITVIMFSISILIFVTGLIQTGKRENLFTFVAIMGCLPAAKAAVGMILICLQKPLDAELYKEMQAHVKDMTVLYESVISSYEKNIPLPCIVVSGLHVICYTTDAKLDTKFAEDHIKKILHDNGYKSNVKIFRDTKSFFRRLDEVYPHHLEMEAAVPFEPDERYPDLTRNELVKHVLLAISV